MTMSRLLRCVPIPTVLVATTAMVACGGRELEAASNSGSESTSSTGDDTNDASVSLSATTTMTTTTMTTDATTTDPVTTEPADTSTGDPDTTGNPETTDGGMGCCDVHRTPGCDEDAVSACVCDAAPECCVFGWAENCVELAMGACEATCMSSEESSAGPSEESSTGVPGGDCDETVQIELTAEDATLDGWELVQSAFVEEGTVAGVIQGMGPPQGTVTWDLDIPCNDTFHVWVRGRNAGASDSYFARLDGGPDPAPIFELDCEGGDDYSWQELNWRDPENGLPCVYVEDPWLADWDEGSHQVQLEYRESPGVSRLIVTNDDAFVPE